MNILITDDFENLEAIKLFHPEIKNDEMHVKRLYRAVNDRRIRCCNRFAVSPAEVGKKLFYYSLIIVDN
jgi:hypothetical protein